LKLLADHSLLFKSSVRKIFNREKEILIGGKSGEFESNEYFLPQIKSLFAKVFSRHEALIDSRNVKPQM